MLHNLSASDQYDRLVCFAAHLAVRQRHPRVNYAFEGYPLPDTEMQTKEKKETTNKKPDGNAQLKMWHGM